MGYSDYLKNLLKPLGIYDLSAGSLSSSELDALGLGLDHASKQMDYAEREGALSTALPLPPPPCFSSSSQAAWPSSLGG